jgi:hypothetical protein
VGLREILKKEVVNRTGKLEDYKGVATAEVARLTELHVFLPEYNAHKGRADSKKMWKEYTKIKAKVQQTLDQGQEQSGGLYGGKF